METKNKRKVNFKKWIGAILFITLIFSVIYIIVMMSAAPETAGEKGEASRGDYSLMLLQCSLGLLVMFLPSVLQKKFSIEIPNYMFIMYFVFLYCAIYLGEVRNFYFVIPNWDLYLHTFSGAMLGALGFSLVSILNDNDNVPIRLSPGFVTLFAFCFALACGVVWEIYEFTVDSIAALNMQKYALESGELLIGRAALADTMEDLIVDTAGALVVCLAGYVVLKLRRKRESIVDDKISKKQEKAK